MRNKKFYEGKVNKILMAIFVVALILIMRNQVNADMQEAVVTDANGFKVTWQYEIENNKAVNVRVKEVFDSSNNQIVPTTATVSPINEDCMCYNHTYKRMIIPSQLGGKDVVSIGDGTNRIINPSVDKTVLEIGIEEVTIPNTVQKINKHAFEDCCLIYDVDFGTSLKTIDDYAFRNCIMIGIFGSVDFPNSLEIIGKGAFEYNANGNFFINKYNNIDTNAYIMYEWYFWKVYYGGHRFRFGTGLKTIGDFAFAGNKNLKVVNIPANVTSVGKGAFANCYNIQEINIAERIENLTIGNNAFSNVVNQLQHVTIPSNVTLGEYVFSNNVPNGVLQDVTIQNGMTSLPNGTFRNCKSLNNVINSVNFTQLGNETFAGCESINNEKYNQLVSSATKIGDNCFSGCTGLTGTIIVPSVVTDLGKYVFSSCKNIETAELTANYTTLPDGLFSKCTSLRSVVKPNSIVNLGDNCFNQCTSLTINEVNNNLLQNIKKIGNGSFSGCTGLTGTLTLTQDIEEIGENAFYKCTGINNIEFNNKVAKIGKQAFYDVNLPEIIRFPESVVEIGQWAFSTVREAFFGAENVNLADRWFSTQDVITHFKNCKHSVKVINKIQGINVVNTATNSNFENGEYACESSLALRVDSQDSNFVVRIVKGGRYAHSPLDKQFIQLGEDRIIALNNITRDTEIRIQKSENDTDLVLREFITKVNNVDAGQSREPFISTNRETYNNEPINYSHTKYPVSVDKGDTVTYAIRVYNEDDKAGKADKVRVYLQDGLELDKANTLNSTYMWEEESTENGTVISTEYLKNKSIPAYPGSGRPQYEEIQLVCKVTKDEAKTLVNIAELVESSDYDSTGGNMSLANVVDYKKQESYESTDDSFIQSEEDDTDYETVELKAFAKVGYTIAVQKIDSTDLELINGAKFILYDENGNELERKEVTSAGKLEFSERVSYGEGIDTYYIEEAEPPFGYKKTIDGKLMLTVEKTIDDTGKLNLKIICEANELTDYPEDREFIPISTHEQLRKIGSGEQIEIGGKTYTFARNANYELLNDLDFTTTGVVSSIFKPVVIDGGIFEGNGHTISGIRFASDAASVSNDMNHAGLFSEFSGTIRNLNLSTQEFGLGLPSEGHEEEPGQSALIGYMYEGTIENVNVNSKIHGKKNIGGFIGHTGEGKVIKIKNCTFEGEVEAFEYNAGGLVGCAKENVEIENCVNKGQINAHSSCSGGLIGVAVPTGETKDNILVEYDAENATINIAVKNRRVNGKYNLAVHKIEKFEDRAETLDGAEFSIYDDKMQIVTFNGQQLSNVPAVNGKLEIADMVIDSMKADVFYIRETKAPEGYNKVDDLVKVVITKTWNSETNEYGIDLVPSIVEGITETQDANSNMYTGVTYESSTNDNYIVKRLNRVRISNCKNEGRILCANGPVAGGLVGFVKGNFNAYDCRNEGLLVVSHQSAGGIVGQVVGESDESAKFVRCYNGKENSDNHDCGSIVISHADGRATQAGIVGLAHCDITFEKCINYADINGGDGHIAGIIAMMNGNKINIYDCINYGNIEANGNGSSNSDAAGILALKFGETSSHTYLNGVFSAYPSAEFDINIVGCKNKGGVYGAAKAGGIVGHVHYGASNESKINISNCEVGIESESDNPSDWLRIAPSGNGQMTAGAGLLGKGYANYMKFNNNTIKNVLISSSGNDGSRCKAGGLVGDIYMRSYAKLYSIEANNNNIEKMYITAQNVGRESHSGGLIGNIQVAESLNMRDNTVKKLNIYVTEKEGYTGLGGLIGFNDTEETHISNCNVINSDISYSSSSGAFTQVGGLIGATIDHNVSAKRKCVIEDCNVISNDGTKHRVTNSLDDQYSPVGGFIGTLRCDEAIIKNCNVKNMSVYSGKNGKSSRVGGFIGSFENDGWYEGHPDNPLQLEKDNVEDCIINLSCNGDNTNSIVGGFIGYCCKINMNNCKLSDMIINGMPSSEGGLIGETSGGNIENVEMTNIKINQVEDNNAMSYVDGGVIALVSGDLRLSKMKIDGIEMDIWRRDASCIGGIVGCGHDRFTLEDSTINNIKIKRQGSVESRFNNYQYTCIGGVAGIAERGAEINNNTFNNIDIKAHLANIGGLIGYNRVEENSTSSIQNNVLSDVSLEVDDLVEETDGRNHDGSYYRGAHTFGGLIAVQESVDTVIDNNTINGLEIKDPVASNQAHMGGIIGYVCNSVSQASADNPKIANTKVNGFNITNASKEGKIGGIIGVIYNGDNYTMENVEVSNMKAEGNNAIGGILGCGVGIINNAKVTNMDTLCDEENIPSYKKMIVGGIAGIAVEQSEISNSNVGVEAVSDTQTGEGENAGNTGNTQNAQNNTHTLKSNYFAGGIAGICSGTIHDVTVKDIIVKSLSELPGTTTGTTADQPSAELPEGTDPIPTPETTDNGVPADIIQKAKAIAVQYINELRNCVVNNVTVVNGSSSVVVNE